MYLTIYRRLKVLMWKNFLHRKRNKVRLIVEMMLPLLLFLILCWVRLRVERMRTFVGECHLKPKAMPSSGALPFFHNLFCTIDNACHSHDAHNLTYNVVNVNISDILRQTLFANYTREELDKNLFKMENITRKILLQSATVISNIKLNATDPNIIFRDVANAIINITKFMSSEDTKPLRFLFEKMFSSNENVNPLVCARQIIKFLRGLFCGINESSFDVVLTTYREQMNKFTYNSNYTYNSDSTPYCNKIFQYLESNVELSVFWKMVKPFISGKIVYTPYTKATARVMATVNETFIEMSRYRDAIRNFIRDAWPEYEAAIRNLAILARFQANEENFDLGKTENLFFSVSKSLFNNLTEILQCVELNKIIHFENASQAFVNATNLLTDDKLWAMVSFENETGKLNHIVRYKIRMDTERVDNTNYIKDRWRNIGMRRRPTADLKYITFGFSFLQDMIDRGIIAEQTGHIPTTAVYLQQFPYPSYIDDKFITAIAGTFPLLMVISWLYSCAMIVKSIVVEKELVLKEMMSLMGLTDVIYWLSWLLDCLIPATISVAALAVLLVFGGLMKGASFTLVFAFLWAYCLATIAQAFLISAFFSRSNLAAACAAVIFFLSYLPYPFSQNWLYHLSNFTLTILCLSSNVAFGIGCSYLAYYEQAGIGATWDNFHESPYMHQNFALSDVFYSLLWDAFIYTFLAYFVQSLFPGKYGIGKYQSLMEMLVAVKRFVIRNERSNLAEEALLSGDGIEAEPKNFSRSIMVENLSKIYSNGKVALENLSVNFFENQITALVGPNGAGKTTAISILTGMMSPTLGSIKVYGMDILRDMDAIRNQLGFCPQHNVLFQQLTVEEHLWFYSSLRKAPTYHSSTSSCTRTSRENMKDEIETVLTDVDLKMRKKYYPPQLSGGMKRKLSIAIAFIGKTKTIILDEPTSGIDAFSRRTIWKLLSKYKKGRTIVFTTHYMEEAELISDRVAIISGGRMKCCGSVAFLKETYFSNAAYYLTAEFSQPPFEFKAQDEYVAYKEKCVSRLNEAVKSVVHRSKIMECAEQQIILSLPMREGNYECQLENLFSFLDKIIANIGFSSYSICPISLEQVFLKVLAVQKEDGESESDHDDVLLYSQKTVRNLEYVENDKNMWNAFVALCAKRGHRLPRIKKSLFAELVIPALFVGLMLLATSFFPPMSQRPPLILSPWMYGHPLYTFNSNESEIENVQNYTGEIFGPDGYGCLCVEDSTKEMCYKNRSSGMQCFYPPAVSSSVGSSNAKLPCWNIVSNGDFMFNTTDIKVSEWILDTWIKYETTRYGGFTFGSSTSIIWNFTGSSMNNFNFTYHNKKDYIQVWFNNKGWASSASYMNAINNVVLRSLLNEGLKDSYGIVTVNHPMNYTDGQLKMQLLRRATGMSVLHAIGMIFALGLVPASFVSYLIEERVSKSMHLQFLSGLNKCLYWAHAFFYDLCNFIICCFLCICLLFIFEQEAYVSSGNLPYLLLLMFFFGWSVIPMMYFASRRFSSPSTAFVTLACINLFTGVITITIVFVIASLQQEDLKGIEKSLRISFRILFPHFCFTEGLIELASNYVTIQASSAFGVNITGKDANGVLKWNLICMLITGPIFFVLNLIIGEINLGDILFSTLRKFPKSWKADVLKVVDEMNEDEDVLLERNVVKNENISTNRNQDILIIKNLTKVYYKRNVGVAVVDDICLRIRKGECFGLLGLNGAGKTTTFKMLTGELKATSGDAYICGFSVQTGMRKVRRIIGYCPQFDALDNVLLVRQHLSYYAAIRAVPSSLIPTLVTESIKQFGLSLHANQVVGKLSIGNKRKLSSAIAFLGKRRLIFLDEPTSGMDACSKRFLWTRIRQMIQLGHSVVLTSHSMEECEVLCTRLTIMVNGRFSCLGSCQQLKSKFGQGYNIMMRCPSDDKEEEIMTYFTSRIPPGINYTWSTNLHYCNQITLQIPSSIQLSNIFKILHGAKLSGLLLDYSLSQTSLEQIFLKFAAKGQVSNG